MSGDLLVIQILRVIGFSEKEPALGKQACILQQKCGQQQGGVGHAYSQQYQRQHKHEQDKTGLDGTENDGTCAVKNRVL